MVEGSYRSPGHSTPVVMVAAVLPSVETERLGVVEGAEEESRDHEEDKRKITGRPGTDVFNHRVWGRELVRWREGFGRMDDEVVVAIIPERLHLKTVILLGWLGGRFKHDQRRLGV